MKPDALYIRNAGYTNRVVDLKQGEAGSALIGYAKNDRSNQKWTFVPVDIDANQYELWCTTTIGDIITQYAKVNANDFRGPRQNDTVEGSDSSTVWTVLVQDDGKFRISVKDIDGNRIFWTLLKEAEGTVIILVPYMGASSQYWTQESS